MEKEILDIILALFYGCILGLTAIFVSRWLSRIEDCVRRVKDYLDYTQSRNDAIYLNQLFIIRDKLAKEERYEEAAQINEIINNEIKKQKKNGKNN